MPVASGRGVTVIDIQPVQCRICLFLKALPEEDRRAWQEDLSDLSITNESVVRAMADWEVSIGETSVRRHRRNHIDKTRS